jgi:diacylglycerol kinase
MKKSNKFTFSARLQSFKYAIEGIFILFKTEHNAWIHLFSGFIVALFGFYLNLSKAEWCFIVFAIGFVIVTEIINTSIEHLTDIVAPSFHEKAKKVKDLAAGGVLISAIVAGVIGLIVFLPKIF